jgi:nicotinamide-nucleotide amidase
MNKTYKISLISIGDEICIGQTLNTNVQWISKEIVKLGGEVTAHLTIKDDENDIVNSINYLKNISNLIIVTGGLGPTHDDITKKVLTEYFNDKLELNEDILKYLKDYFALRNREFLQRHYEQAFIPSKAKIFNNKIGTAQGMFFDEKVKLLSMPGVPREMKHIMENGFLEFIQTQIKLFKYDVVLYRTLRTAGVPESTLADLIGDVSFLGQSSLAFLPSYSGVKLRIGTSAENFFLANQELDRLEKHIIEKCGKYIYSNSDEELESFLANILLNNNFTISAAESCTGGIFGAKITSLAGSSAYFNGSAVTYSNKAKMEILGVSKDTLDTYGAVSEECALEMAIGSLKIYNSDFAISITGIAGPEGGTEDKPVGTVWIGFASKSNSFAKKFIFTKDREINRELSVHNALNLLVNQIKV